ncbi:MAG: tRNA (adenosine(37)-N6)-dimethylallyltransferase MiaA [Bacillota bacterium]|nr:tRNA (adenosine(37)-N6)-dimethylallyltransferase MiaA [Bacillota bacterium]
MAQPQLIIVVGPTACGKTALSLNIAQRLDCEIISGDSMQVYRGMDIGTAKLPPSARRGIAHHLLDIRDPDQAYSVADFREDARQAIADIDARGKRSLLVGGSGLYINAVINPYNFEQTTAQNDEIRAQLRREIAASGAEALHQRLAEIDPEAAARIHAHDTHRLIRALEVYMVSGRTISEMQRRSARPPDYRLLMLGLTMEREHLYRRIEQRVDEMLAQGLLDEVRGLLNGGLSIDAVSMQGLGYRQLAAYLSGRIDYPQAVELIKRDTRRFAKRQFTWFKRDPRIKWFDLEHYRREGEADTAVLEWLARRLEEE